MQTTISKSFMTRTFASLAGVQNKTRKQLIGEIAKDVLTGVDKARGLQGKWNWPAAATEIQKMSDLLIQGVDLAETIGGVQLPKVREQVQMVKESAVKAERTVDNEETGEEAKSLLRSCESALSKAAKIVLGLSDRLGDTLDKCDGFSENWLIKEVK